MNIRRRIGIVMMVFVSLAAGMPVLAQETVNEDQEWQRVNECTQRAIGYILSQQKEDGSIVENNRNQTTITAFAIMGMLSVGHKPTDQTPEGLALRKALAYVLRPDRQEDDGYFGNRDGSRMYGQGIIALMLAEVMGMGVDDEQDRLIRVKLQKAIDLILRAQAVKKDSPQEEGGWRYNPNSTDTDLSVSSWHLMALKAANNAGIKVPKEAIDKGIGYVKRCFHWENNEKKTGFFCYRPGENNMRFGSSAGGFLVMQICGLYDAPEVKATADYYMTYNIPSLQEREHYYYGMYYYSQGMFQQGGAYAKQAQKVVRELLMNRQQPDGSWPLGPADEQGGKVYVTSLSLLSLSIHYHFLPIYQR